MMKLYSIKHRLVLLLLLLIGSTSFAQQIWKSVYDYNSGAIYTYPGSILVYNWSIENNTADDWTNVTLQDVIPTGTTYVPGSTRVNDITVSDINGSSPISTTSGMLIPSPNGLGNVPAGTSIAVVLKVTVNTNAGSISTNTGHLLFDNSSQPRNTLSYMSTNIPVNQFPYPTCTKAYMISNNNTTGAPSKSIYVADLTNSKYTTPVTVASQGYIAADGLLWQSVLLRNSSAIAFDNATNRLYFVNNSTTTQEELYYVDFNFSPGRTYKFSRTVPYYMNLSVGTGYNITRMTFTSSGYGYAITDNGQEFIKFSVTGITPTITNLGSLIDDAGNAHSVLTETGGDISSDYTGKLYLITGSGNLYTIDPATKIATFIAPITGLPTTNNNSVAIGADGKLVVGGEYRNSYRVDMSSLRATPLLNDPTLRFVITNTAYASCYYPQVALRQGVTPATNTPTVVQATAKISPNPFIDNLNLQVALPAAGTVKIRLIDLFGRTAFATTEKMASGVNTVHLSVPASLSSGIYILDIWAGNKRLLQKKLTRK